MLSAEELKQITDVMATSIAAAMKPINPPKGDGEPTPPKGDSSTPPTALDATDVATKVMEMMKESKSNEQGEVYATLWNDKYANAIASAPGLGEFLEGKDDYGNVRKDEIDKIEKYEDRINALAKLTNSFNEAVAGTPGTKPIVNIKQEKKLAEATESYDKINQKMAEGKYTSEAELAKDWFDAITNEANAI